MGAHLSVPMYRRSLPQRYQLVGARCTACQRINFPPKAACNYCGTGGFEEVRLSGRGKVFSFTKIAAAAAPPEFDEDAKVVSSFPVALVELEEGAMIMAHLADCDDEDVKIGLEVEMVIRRIYAEENVMRYGYKFRPVRK